MCQWQPAFRKYRSRNCLRHEIISSLVEMGAVVVIDRLGMLGEDLGEVKICDPLLLQLTSFLDEKGIAGLDCAR